MKNQIVVLKMKDIIKKAVFLVIGIVVIVFFIGMFTEDKETVYNEGTYQADIVLNGKAVVLNVTVDDNAIKNITLSDLSETQSVFYPTFNSCFEDISNSVLEAQSTDIEIPKDYSMTGQILLSAIDSALNQAKK